jgi:hypothetical protein
VANPENLIPHRVKPGEVKNPTGINQYTYRREAEQHLEEWCKEYGRELVRVIADAARAGKPWAAKLILDRVLPAVEKHEHSLTESTGASALLDRLAGVAVRRRTNGSGGRADAGRANGGNGAAS